MTSAGLSNLRSLLFAPGSDERKLTRALESDADAVVADLEDAVTAAEKGAGARPRGSAHGHRGPGPARAVRINGTDTEFWEEDAEALEGARAGRDRAAEGDTGGCRRARLAGPAAHRDRGDRARRTPRLRDRVCVRGSRRSRSGRPISAPSSGSSRAPTAWRSCSRARRSSSTRRRPASARLSTSSTSTRGTTTASRRSRSWRARSAWAARCASTRPRSRSSTACSRRTRSSSTGRAASSRPTRRASSEGRGAVALDGEMIDLPVVVRARRLLEKERG